MEVSILKGAAINRSVYEVVVDADVATGGRRVPKIIVEPFLALLLTKTLLSAPATTEEK